MAPSDLVARQFRAFSSTFAEISARRDPRLLNGYNFAKMCSGNESNLGLVYGEISAEALF